MDESLKNTLLKRLNRIEGQVRGIARMIDDDRCCIDIITQTATARAALRRVEEEVLRDQINSCLQRAMQCVDAEERRQNVAELMDLIAKSAH